MNDPMMDELYWGAFAGRLAAFGLGGALLRMVPTSGDFKEPMMRLNEFLRLEIPELSDDSKALEHLIQWREQRLKGVWDYRLPRGVRQLTWMTDETEGWEA